MRKSLYQFVRRAALIMALGALTLHLAACGGGGKEEAEASSGAESAVSVPETEEEEKKLVGIALPAVSAERWNRDGEALVSGFRAEGYEASLVFSNNSASRQTADVAQLIRDGADLLVIAPTDGAALSDVLSEAKEKGIPVISYDRLIPDSDAVSYFVSFNHYAGGRLVGEYVAEALDLKNADSQTVYHIEFMSGDLADTNSGFFFNGTYDVLKTYLDAGNLAVPSEAQTFVETATAGWSSAAAGSRMNDLLEQYYGGETALDAVICADDTLALGVDQAIEENYQGKNTVIVTGQGGDEENLAKIIDGSQSATVFLPTADEAEVTLALGKSLLEGVFPDSSLIEENSWAFHCTYDTQSYDNGAGVAASYLLDPVVITAENMQKELIDTGYYVMEEDLPKAAETALPEGAVTSAAAGDGEPGSESAAAAAAGADGTGSDSSPEAAGEDETGSDGPEAAGEDETGSDDPEETAGEDETGSESAEETAQAEDGGSSE